MLSAPGRAGLFWVACMPLRAYLATRGDVAWLRAFGAVVGVRWVAGLEDSHTGAFGGPAWWADARPVHGALWLAYAATGAAAYLRLDVAFGALNWFAHRPSIAP